MPHFRLASLAAALAALLVARPAAAQIIEPRPLVPTELDEETSAWLGLTLTPAGALAPTHESLLRPAGAGPDGVRLNARLGSLDRGGGLSQRTLAATLDIDVVGATLSLTGGYLDVACDDDVPGADGAECDGGMVLEVRLGRALAGRSLDATGSRRLVLGVEGGFGFSSIDIVSLGTAVGDFDVSMVSQSATVALPIALVARAGRTTIAPFVSPRLGWGRTEIDIGAGGDPSGSGVRPMIGAGIALRTAARLGLDLGVQRVLVDDAETTLGVAASFAF